MQLTGEFVVVEMGAKGAWSLATRIELFFYGHENKILGKLNPFNFISMFAYSFVCPFFRFPFSFKPVNNTHALVHQ